MSRPIIVPVLAILVIAGPSSLAAAPCQSGGVQPYPGRLYTDVHDMLAQPLSDVLYMAADDIDGDGDIDVFQGRATVDTGFAWGSRNAIWTNDGTGRFGQTEDSMPDFADLTYAALLVDLTGDERPEILLRGDYMYGADRLLLNNGGGGFTEMPGGFPDDEWSEDFAAADVDGDGDTDVACARDGQDALFLGDGAGGFVDGTSRLPVDLSSSEHVIFVNVDGDGDEDLVIGKQLSLCLYLNDGNGYFTDASGNLPGGQYSVSAGDVEGDGDQDLLCLGHLFLNDGSGMFWDMGYVASGELRDVDGDLYPDIFQPDTLFLNDGTGSFSDESHRLPVLGAASAWTMEDFDADGDSDYVLAQIVWDYVRRPMERAYLVLNDGSCFFEDVTAFSSDLPLQKANAAALADMDGDGDVDVVTGASLDGPMGTWEQKLFLFHNDGSGRFTDRSDLVPWAWTLFRTVALGDVDGDGDNDIVPAGIDNDDGEGGGTRLFLNEGASGFMDASGQIPSSTYHTVTHVVLEDVDGDGDLDILQTNEDYPPFPDRLFLNDSTGVFSTYTTLPTPVENTYRGAMVDIDGDQDLDIVTVGDAVRLFRNDGAAVFTDVSGSFPPTSGTALGTGDGDGDVDVVVGAHGPDVLYRNDGTGKFTDSPGSLPAEDWQSYDLALVDVDQDGDPDYVALGRTDGNSYSESKLYLNDGAGEFTDASYRMHDALLGTRVAFGDVDEDGDPDLVASGTTALSARLWTNLRRHLAWRAIPRIGQTMHLDVTGEPDDPWMLAYSAGRTRIPLGIGVLFLDPFTAVMAGSGTMNAVGKGTFPVGIPNDVGLVGEIVYWQAMIGTPVRLSNLEITTITGL